MEADTSISKPTVDLTLPIQATILNRSAMKTGMKRDSVIIDLDYYANKAAGKKKVDSEVIDVDSRAIRDMNVIDVDLYSERVIIDVDSYANHTVPRKKARRDIIDLDSYSSSWEQVKDDDDEVVLVREDKKTKLMSTVKKAAVSSDQWLPDYIKNNYYIIEMAGEIYDAMLTRTNLEDNSNEFYVIQVLKSNNDLDQSYMVYNRWGTVGQKGKIKLSGPHFSCHSATSEFEEKFYEMTKNYWSERINFVSFPMCYTWLELDYSKKDQGESSVSRAARRFLNPRVARFISLICNIRMMTQQMRDIGYDAEKLPLKNLSKQTILKGYDVLQLIDDVIMGHPNRKLLEELSGYFYTIIPHDFGNKRLSEFVIDTPQKLKSKLEMVEVLGEIEHAAAFLSIGVGMQEDPVYTHYQQLRCDLLPVEATSKEFHMIENYLKQSYASATPNYNTYAPNYNIFGPNYNIFGTNYNIFGTNYNTYPTTYAPNPNNCAPKIVEIFRVSKEEEQERFTKHAGTKNRMLLWHGSRLTNWASILSQGLRIALVAKPGLFGKGIYFADMFTKSIAYCGVANGTAVLLLCEVALGEMQEYPTSCNHPLPLGKQSVKGLGVVAPSGFEVLEDGVIVPLGIPVRQTKGQLSNNEYIVYQEHQVRMRYVVQVDFMNR